MHDIPYGIDIVNVFSYVPKGQEALAQPFYDTLKMSMRQHCMHEVFV